MLYVFNCSWVSYWTWTSSVWSGQLVSKPWDSIGLLSMGLQVHCHHELSIFSPSFFIDSLWISHHAPHPLHFSVLSYLPSHPCIFFSNMGSAIKLRFSCLLACTLLTMSSSHPNTVFSGCIVPSQTGSILTYTLHRFLTTGQKTRSEYILCSSRPFFYSILLQLARIYLCKQSI